MKTFPGIYILSVFICFSLYGCKILDSQDKMPPSNTNNDNDSACDILLIGSSYFNSNNLPGLLSNLSKCTNKHVNIHFTSGGGPYLADHAQSQITESKIYERDWDFVILQGVGTLVAYPEIFIGHPVAPALKTLKKKISSKSESTKMVFCLPWAFEDGMAWKDGWTDQYPEMQKKIYDNTLEYAEDIGFIIAPVGWAWNRVLEEKNYPQHYLHVSDWNHPSIRGSYLMACVIYSTLFKESTSGMDYFAGLPENEAAYFQTVASSVVLDSLNLWNIEQN